MLLIDVNLLIDSHRAHSPAAEEVGRWLERALAGPETIALPDVTLSAFLRITTDRRIFSEPSTLAEGSAYLQILLERRNVLNLQPSPGFWPRMLALCRDADARGPLIPDAYLATLAIESGATLVTLDRGFARFPGLRWQLPGGR